MCFPEAAAFLWFSSMAFVGGKKIPESHSLCLIKGQGEARCAQALGDLRFAQQGKLTCRFPSLVLSLLLPVADE